MASSETRKSTLQDPLGSLAALESVLGFLEQKWEPGMRSGHHRRVQWLSLALAEKLHLGASECAQLSLAAAFHDLGQIALPDGLLNTPGRLSTIDYERVKAHPAHSVQILSHAIHDPVILGAIRHHHEQFGGGGYPDNLVGEEIPLLARILAVPEVFDSMVHDRPWRHAMTLDRARNLLYQYRGSLFDPRVIEAFMDIDPQALSLQFLNIRQESGRV